ncbi:MAG: sialidase family protein [Gallionella sp.]
MRSNSHHLVLVVILLGAVAALYRVASAPAAPQFQIPEYIGGYEISAPSVQTHFVTRTMNIHTHAASLVELGNGQVRAFWFAGSQEGASDVEVRSAVYDPVNDHWSTEEVIANRQDTQRALHRYVKKIGNPVPYRSEDGRLWLFYVTVSLGGWAGSSITFTTSTDEGKSWSVPQRLITSPFLNISTLVKGTPFRFSDGTIGLPVYHEFIGKFGELLRVDQSGHILSKTRLSSGKQSLQPVLMVQSPVQAKVLMRYAGASPMRVLETSTTDAGEHWMAPHKTSLANPNSAITGLVLPDGKFLMAVNDTEHGRNTLSLVITGDEGTTWKIAYQLELQPSELLGKDQYAEIAAGLARATEADVTNAAGYASSAQRTKCESQGCGFEFSYPYLIRTRKGDFHLVYTWNRSFIKHVRFNLAWLESQIGQSDNAKLH